MGAARQGATLADPVRVGEGYYRRIGTDLWSCSANNSRALRRDPIHEERTARQVFRAVSQPLRIGDRQSGKDASNFIAVDAEFVSQATPIVNGEYLYQYTWRNVGAIQRLTSSSDG